MLPRCCQNAYTFPQRWKTNRGNLFPQIRYWSQRACWASDISPEKWMSNGTQYYFFFFFYNFLFFLLMGAPPRIEALSPCVFCVLLIENVNFSCYWFCSNNVISLTWSCLISLVYVSSRSSVRSQLCFFFFFFPKLLNSAVPLEDLREWTGSQLTGWRHTAHYIMKKECQREINTTSVPSRFPRVQAGGLE